MWKRIRLFFSRLWDAVTAVDDYIHEILQVVEWVAEKTPARTDDEIVAVIRGLGLQNHVSTEEMLANRDKGRVLAMLVEEWARRKWPNAPTRRIRRAIELAYGMLRP